MKQNLKAKCRTCKFGTLIDQGTICCICLPYIKLKEPDDWCGQHPDFWQEEAPAPVETLAEACARGDVSGQIRDVESVDLDAIRKEISDLFWTRGSTIPECVDAAMAHIERLAKRLEGKKESQQSPLTLHAKELLLAAWKVWDSTKETSEELTALRVAIGKCEGEIE